MIDAVAAGRARRGRGVAGTRRPGRTPSEVARRRARGAQPGGRRPPRRRRRPVGADADPARALVIRVGYGSGEQVAEGDWESARELPVPRRAPSARALLSPQERLAALLGGRDAALACEELALRARGDLDHGRAREAALQTRDRARRGAGGARGVARHGRHGGPARGAGRAPRRGRAPPAQAALQGGLSEADAAAVRPRWGGSRRRCGPVGGGQGGRVARANCGMRRGSRGCVTLSRGSNKCDAPLPSLPSCAAVRATAPQAPRPAPPPRPRPAARRRSGRTASSSRVTTAIRPPASSVTSGSPATG